MSRHRRGTRLFFFMSVLTSLVVSASAQVNYTTNTTINSDLGPNSAIVGYSNTSPTVNLVSGGLVESGYDLESYNASTVNINGGTVTYDLFAYNTSTVNLNSGSVGFLLFAENNSTVNVNGGSVGFELDAEDNSKTNITGGNVGTLGAESTSTVNISGGVFGDLRPGDNSTVNISGGNITNIVYGFGNTTVNITGGSFGELDLYDNSVFNLKGTGLSDVLVNANYLSGQYSQYALSGKLEDGTDLTGKYIYVVNSDHGTFNLEAVPEPAFYQMSALLTLGGIGLLRMRCRLN